jgi:hypothetical protein
LNITEEIITTLVLNLKGYGIWTKMKAIYPMVGASAAACAQNLKSDTFNGTFTTGWTFSSNGANNIKGQATFMNTGLLPSSVLTNTSNHLSYYNNLAVSLDGNVIMGNGTLNTTWMGLYAASNQFYSGNGCGYTSTTLGSSTAFFLSNKQNSTTLKFIKNASILETKSVTSNDYSGSQNIHLNNFDSSGTFSSGSRCAFASIGDGLLDTQATALYNAVQTFQNTLGRAITP